MICSSLDGIQKEQDLNSKTCTNVTSNCKNIDMEDDLQVNANNAPKKSLQISKS